MAVPGARYGRSSGFTLVELIVVIVLLGIVASIAGPRFANKAIFDERGFADEVRAAIRYAQKVAVAQRRLVCLDFSATQLAVVYVAAAACNGAAPVADPGSGAPYVVTAPNNVTVTATDFAFNGLGQPVTLAGVPLAAQRVIQTTKRQPILVDPETGYVH